MGTKSPTFLTRSSLRTDRGNRRKFTEHELKVSRRLRDLWNHRARDLNLTQAKAAQKMNVSQSLIAQYLTGHLVLNERFILRFAKLLEVPPTEIDPLFSTYLPSIKHLFITFSVKNNIYAPRVKKGDTLLLDESSPTQIGDPVLITSRETDPVVGILQKFTKKCAIISDINARKTDLVRIRDPLQITLLRGILWS